MSEQTIPVLSPEQKNEILLLHRKSLTLQMNMIKLQAELESVTQSITSLLSAIIAEMKLDVNLYVFDLDALELRLK